MGPQIPPELLRLLMARRGMLPQPSAAPQGAPGMPPPQGMQRAPSAPPVQGQLGALGAPGTQRPGQVAQLGSVTPEQAAAERFEALKRAGQMPGQAGMFDGLTPSGPGRSNNLFAGSKNWYQGIFNTTNRLTPFDSFFVDETQSASWL